MYFYKRYNIFLITISICLISSSIFSIIPTYAEKTVETNGNKFYVGGTGPGNYSNIQPAIDDAENGDIIFVYNGTYKEELIIQNSLNITSINGPENTIIEGKGVINVVIISDIGQVNLIGFTIQSNAPSPGIVGIELRADSNYISKCIIKNNVIGISSGSYGYQKINHCNITSNTQEGISFDQGNFEFNISHCIIEGNGGDGIILQDVISTKKRNIIYNCSIKSNDLYEHSAGITAFRSKSCDIINCPSINGHNIGISLWDCSDFVISDSVISNSTSNGEGAIYIGATSRCTIKNNIIENNTGYGIKIVKVDTELVGTANNNEIYGNTFKNNSNENAWDECSNFWDMGNISGGNEWDDYKDKYPNAKLIQDGDFWFWDTPYEIPGKIFNSNKDNYPIANEIRYDPPCISIVYPKYEEILSGDINIEWLLDDPDTNLENISIYINVSNETSKWKEWNNLVYFPSISDTSDYMWNTTEVENGIYKIMITAIDEKNAVTAVNLPFIINNNGPYVSKVTIKEKIKKSDYAKDGDTIIILADIPFEKLDKNNIWANLSQVGKENWANPNQYSGTTAIWEVSDINTNEYSGDIHIVVKAYDVENKIYGKHYGTIQIDNKHPEIKIYEPKTGIYIFDKEIIPFPLFLNQLGVRLIFGQITIKASTYDSETGINNVNCKVDGNVIPSSNDGIFEWNYHYDNIVQLFNPKHKIEITAYDHAGNSNSDEITIWKYF